ncbi:hypothetical protein F2P81_009984 [Scophthalmus maximus]|uniref:Guanine nucleotide-binding protein subunit alpha-12 n=1 Tax=Scophthalmus maximus TaxID=52904 RepID=A0A6A4SZ61_SCOMX|nr:hypothetical protein F2P81_009984 [Scophthalmus maximus]
MSGVVRTLSRCLLPADAGREPGGGKERGRERDAAQEREARRRSREIDAMLARERRAVRRLVKILLLGAGESGKSTFLKQMRIINGQEFDHKALLDFRDTIYENILKGMRVLVDARDKLGIGWQSCENEKQGMLVMSWEGRVGATGVEPGEFQLYVMALSALWADAGVREAYTRRAEFQLSESVKYFLDNLDRIGQLSYSPSKQDILFARKATKGIVEHDFVIKKIPFKMVDVGGQRSQRQKWFQCFDGITSILFMVSSSEYDQAFLVQSFSRKRRNRGKPLFHHFTTAVDTENIRFVFHAVKDTILQENLKDIMLQ